MDEHESPHEPDDREADDFELPSWIDEAIARSQDDSKGESLGLGERSLKEMAAPRAADHAPTGAINATGRGRGSSDTDPLRFVEQAGDGSLPSFIDRDLPPSLRADRLARDRALSTALWVATVLLLGGAVAVLFLNTQHGQPPGREFETRPTAVTRIAPRRSAPAVGSLAATPQPAATAQPPTLTTPDSSATTANPPASRSGRFAINVGTFRSEETATAERARLASITGLPSRTTTLSEAGATLYRVTLGSFATHDEAAAAADQLVRHGLAAEAFVVPLTGADPARP